MTETTLPDANDLSATKAILAGVLTPGRWAIVPMIPNDEPDETGFYGEEGPLQFIRNWAEVEDDDGANIFGSGDDTDKARFAA